MRSDKGALWENYLVAERMKANSYFEKYVNSYFWRTHDGAEIDYIEENDGKLYAFEIKWKENHNRFPASFLAAYPEHEIKLINRDNFEEFTGA